MKDDLDRIETLGTQGAVDELAYWLAHEDWQLRRAAVDAVVARVRATEPGDRDRMVDAVIRGLYDDENAGFRNAAQEALTRLAPRIGERLIAEVAHAPTDVRILLAPVLGESGRVEAVRPLVELAHSDDANIATSAIIGLGRLHRREAVRPLLGILASGSPWLAFPAVEALGVLGDVSAVDPLAARLDDPLLGSTALDALVRIGGPAAARAIVSRLFGPGTLRGDRLEALVRVAQEGWPEEMASAVRSATVAEFRLVYRPEWFDQIADLARMGSARAEAALEALGWSGDPRALPVLLVALGRPASQASATAGLAVLFEHPELTTGLEPYVAHMSSSVRIELARVLVARAPIEAALVVSTLLSDSDPDLARDAVEVALEAAARIDASRSEDAATARDAVARLMGIVERADPTARAAVVRLAVRAAESAGLDTSELLGQARGLMASADADTALAGIEAIALLSGLGNDERRALEAAFTDPDPFVRLRSIEIAAISPAPEMRTMFANALADEQPLVRRAAVGALATFPDGEVVGLLTAAVSDWHGLVAADALDALAERGGEVSTGALRVAVRSERALLRCVAAARLAHSDDAADRNLVVDLVRSDREVEVRRASVAALAGTRESTRAAAIGLGDSHHAVRRAALRIVAASPDLVLLDRIRELADTDDSADVRGEAIVALTAIAPAEGLERIGAAIVDPALSACAVRALGWLASREPDRLRIYREEDAPPRAAFVIDALYSGHIT